LVGEVVRRVALVEAVEAVVQGLADRRRQPDALVGRHLQGHLVEEVTQIDLLEQAKRFRRADDLLEEGKDQGRARESGWVFSRHGYAASRCRDATRSSPERQVGDARPYK